MGRETDIQLQRTTWVIHNKHQTEEREPSKPKFDVHHTNAKVRVDGRVTRRAGQRLVFDVRNVLMRLRIAVPARSNKTRGCKSMECRSQKQAQSKAINPTGIRFDRFHGTKQKIHNQTLLRTFWRDQSRWDSTWPLFSLLRSKSYPAWCRGE